MKKIKVTVTKMGKRINFKGLTISSPCKFFINEKDKIHFEVLMKKLGINQNTEYFFGEVKKPSKAIEEANAKAKEEVEKVAASVSKEVKKDIQKQEVKKEEANAKAKEEVKKEEVAKKHDFSKKHKKK